ncbi:hypothetical protein DFH11DRAFT_1586252 [Phellopilus nigrolimitatus]|nr:hypothetical protein DFH11DRAFT_1586252 [Phellopilus nigrolimitatus]
MLLGDQQLFVSDPLAQLHMLVKDQCIFEETDTFLMSFNMTFWKSLLPTLGNEYKRRHKMLNPVFNLKHMRDLLPIFHPIAHKQGSLGERVEAGALTPSVTGCVAKAHVPGVYS